MRLKIFLIFLIGSYCTIFAKEKNSVILKRNIFTAPVPPSSPPKSVPSILKPAPLPSLETLIDIIGIIYFPQGNSYVIIKNKKNNNESIYREGEIVEQAKIIKIKQDKVYFEYDNKKVVLNLENKGIESGLIIYKEELKEITKNSQNISKQIPEDIITMNVSFNETINALINDKKLIENLSIIPNISEGKIEGFKISNLPENSLPYQYGLRNGDIVKRVNGILIDSMSTAFKVYNEIKNSNIDIVAVEVIRNNKPILLTYRLNRN